MQMAEAGALTRTLDRIQSEAKGENVKVSDLIAALGEWGVLPVILIAALVTATPLSGIPGVSSVCGIAIAILSAELLLGFREVVLPATINKRSIDAARLRAAMKRIEPITRWVDRRTANRLGMLFHRPLIWIPQVLCLLSGLAMPFLEFIPFSSSVVALGVCFLTTAMMTRDGVFFLLALLPYAGLAWLLFGFAM